MANEFINRKNEIDTLIAEANEFEAELAKQAERDTWEDRSDKYGHWNEIFLMDDRRNYGDDFDGFNSPTNPYSYNDGFEYDEEENTYPSKNFQVERIEQYVLF